MKKSRKIRDKGFTLVELLVCTVLSAVFFSIVFMVLSSALARSGMMSMTGGKGCGLRCEGLDVMNLSAQLERDLANVLIRPGRYEFESDSSRLLFFTMIEDSGRMLVKVEYTFSETGGYLERSVISYPFDAKTARSSRRFGFGPGVKCRFEISGEYKSGSMPEKIALMAGKQGLWEKICESRMTNTVLRSQQQ